MADNQQQTDVNKHETTTILYTWEYLYGILPHIAKEAVFLGR